MKPSLTFRGWGRLSNEGHWLNLAQDASHGLGLKNDLVPQGRLEIGHDAILDNRQPSLRDSYCNPEVLTQGLKPRFLMVVYGPTKVVP
jgi:hypothetical protein